MSLSTDVWKYSLSIPWEFLYYRSFFGLLAIHIFRCIAVSSRLLSARFPLFFRLVRLLSRRSKPLVLSLEPLLHEDDEDASGNGREERRTFGSGHREEQNKKRKLSRLETLKRIMTRHAVQVYTSDSTCIGGGGGGEERTEIRRR